MARKRVDKSPNKARPRRMRKGKMLETILAYFKEQPIKKVLNHKQIAYGLNIKEEGQRQLMLSILWELSELGELTEVSYGKFRQNIRENSVTGVLDRQTVAKKTFLIPDDGGEQVFIAERAMGCALNKDRVKVSLYPSRKGHEPEGEVVEVLERKRSEFVGLLEVKENFAFLNVDKKFLMHDIFIPLHLLNGGKDGQKCIGRIKEWTDPSKNPMGEIVTVLGDTGDNNTEMHAILAEFGLPYSYPKEIEKVADTIKSGITEAEIAKRIDMRDVITCTIDPKDAKDFDDALSIRKLDNGNWEVGVHIADVTHYVEEDSVIETEAVSRATSVYLVDRTIPMLPEHLSNGICSLRPNEEKLTYSVIFEINEFAEIKNSKIGRTITCSDRRFTYEEAQSIIETGEGDYKEEILKLNELAKMLRVKRFATGAIAFERTEVRFDVDEKGKPISVFFKEAKESNKLVEEFMLLANRTVAEFIGKNKKRGGKAKTFVYRVHDVPNPEKLTNFSKFIKRFGYKLKTTGRNSEVSSAINHLLSEVEGKREQNLVETLAIRSMSKAIYTTQNVGHYGLSFDYYTHFTSPIRRYPDMMVHRLLTRYLDGKNSASADVIEELCEHSSEREQLAANAERASIKYKQVEYMETHIGETFDGIISGVTEWGIYVELKANKCEGMVPMRTLDDDFYVFDDKNYCIMGRRGGKRFQLGDEVTVKIERADLIKKQLDFKIV